MKDNPFDFTDIRISNRRIILNAALENNLIDKTTYTNLIKRSIKVMRNKSNPQLTP